MLIQYLITRGNNTAKNKILRNLLIHYTHNYEKSLWKNSGLKKKLENCLTYSERLKLIDKNNKNISINKQSELLWISKSSIYYTKQISDNDKKTMDQIDKIYTNHPYYWSRRIAKQLKQNWYNIWRKKVTTFMWIMWIKAMYPWKKTSISNKEHEKYPYLLKGLEITRPNKVWAIDITYIRLKQWWVYLVVIVDWYSRAILSWDFSLTLELDFCVNALNKALALYPAPDIFNSDQWSQFTSKTFTSILKENEIQISMDWKWRWADNVIIERLFRTIKYEEVYLNDYDTPKQAYESLKVYIDKYNFERLHSSLCYQTPAEVYWLSHIENAYTTFLHKKQFVLNVTTLKKV